MTNTAAATVTLRLDASYVSNDPTQPQAVNIRAAVADVETAEAIVACFPKSTKISASGLRGNPEGLTGYVSFYAKLAKDGVVGEKNEAGIKRLRSLLKAAEKHGIAIEWAAPSGNSYPTREAFEAALNA